MSQYVTKVRTNQGDKQIDYNALANLPTISNPNLLINSDFRNPINQRGGTTYKSTANNFTRIFTVDRWNMQNGCGLTVNDASITLTGDSEATGVSIFSQVVETLPVDSYVLQVKVLNLANGATINVSNSAVEVVFTASLSVGLNQFVLPTTDILIISINVTSNTSVELEWIKLECGTTATLLSPRSYAEELNLCRRYFYKFDARVIMVEYTSEYADGSIYYPIMMRVTPTVKLLQGTYYSPSQGAFVTPASIEVNASHFSENNADIKITRNSSDTFTPGMAVNANVQIWLEAEIT